MTSAVYDSHRQGTGLLGRTPGATLDETIIQARAALSGARIRPPLEFRFVWRRVPHYAMVVELDGSPALHLTAELTSIPFTAESRPNRQWLSALLAFGGHTECGGYVGGPGARLLFEQSIPLPEDLAGSELVARIAGMLLRAWPFYRLARNPGLS